MSAKLRAMEREMMGVRHRRGDDGSTSTSIDSEEEDEHETEPTVSDSLLGGVTVHGDSNVLKASRELLKKNAGAYFESSFRVGCHAANSHCSSYIIALSSRCC